MGDTQTRTGEGWLEQPQAVPALLVVLAITFILFVVGAILLVNTFAHNGAPCPNLQGHAARACRMPQESYLPAWILLILGFFGVLAVCVAAIRLYSRRWREDQVQGELEAATLARAGTASQDPRSTSPSPPGPAP